jgi:hypothetical protein
MNQAYAPRLHAKLIDTHIQPQALIFVALQVEDGRFYGMIGLP